jgi:diguanylate cyclase (GGDEF)-like protein
MQPDPVPEPSADAPPNAAVELLHMRGAIRQAIAGAIGLIVERDVFLRHVVDLVAQVTGRAMVAIYTRSGERGGFALNARTSDMPDHLPTRRPATLSIPRPLLESLDLPDFTRLRRFQRLTLPIVHAHAVSGYLVVMAEESRFSDAEIERFGVVAEELAAACNVAERYHAMQQGCVVDPDTGAFTFEYFNQRLGEELARARRTGHAVTIVLVEPINYIAFERSAGYERGDQVLRALAGDFAAVTRTSDVVSRRGRTGYAVLLPESDVIGARVAIARIRHRLARLSEQLTGAGLGSSAPRFAIGAASAPVDGDDPATLMLIAEQRQFEDETAPTPALAG